MYKNGNTRVVNLLGNAVWQENGMFSVIKTTQTMVKEMKRAQPLNLKLKSLNQIFVIIQTNIFF